MKSEVSIKMQGGLANNLFQIACAYAYALRHNKELVIMNQKFGITHNSLDMYKDNVLKKINLVSNKNFQGFKVFNESQFEFSEIPNIDGNVYLDGYFQSEKYFCDYENEIRNIFSYHENCIPVKEKYKNFLDKNTCSIHIRRGDYLNFPNHHPVQSINYFMKAIRQMPEDSLFMVFSDDINWCKENLPNIEDKFIFIEGNKDYEDLLLMSLCKNNIISNSSFSWWGAWLNENKDKKVYAPSKWFGDANKNKNIVDLYCKNWTKI
jgi:hypothetical protein